MSLFAYSVFAEFLKLKWNPTRFSDLGIIIYSTDLETNYGPELRFKDRTNTNSFEKLAGDKSHPTRKNYDNKSLMLSRITHLFFFFFISLPNPCNKLFNRSDDFILYDCDGVEW